MAKWFQKIFRVSAIARSKLVQFLMCVVKNIVIDIYGPFAPVKICSL